MANTALSLRTSSGARDNGIEFFPKNYFAPLKVSEVFSRPAPLELDLGSGEGSFLVAMAQRFPDRNFLGIERLRGRVNKTCQRIARLGLHNARILRLESAYAVQYLMPPDSVRVLHIGFPDPWPKRRHHSRRLINDPFLQSVVRLLCPGGEVRLTTDDSSYFVQMRQVSARQTQLREISWPAEQDYAQTDFEKLFCSRGVSIHRLRLVKC
jgi:tRNA (guanine-N7-)-methyltransferase